MNAMFEKRKDEDFVRDNITPKTNFDRIKAMSAEELAEFLDDVYNKIDDEFDFPCNGCSEKCNCDICFSEWLKKEAKE